jgi:general secretion pathway protein D
MEVNANKDFKLGVEWRGAKDTGKIAGTDAGEAGVFIGSGGAGTTGSPGGYNIIPDLIIDAATSTISANFPAGFAMGILGAGIKIGDVIFPTIGAVVQAYKTDSEVSILSTPQIMTLNNEEAEINVGSNVPYVTRQDTTTAATVDYSQYEYRDVGVTLNITPNINEGNYIRLKISQQVTKVTSLGANTKVVTPTTLKRTIKTSVVVKDRETIVIGGLIGDSTQTSNYRVPFLGEIPILGWLFRTRSTGREKTNLYVFITPHIVRTQEDASALYKEKKDSMGRVEEGVIKLDDKKPAAAPQSKPLPAAEEIPDKS